MKLTISLEENRLPPGTAGKINAPSFIYWVIYGEYPSGNMSGRTTQHPEKIVDGVGIDKAIPTQAIKDINKIEEIEPRSSCQGESETKPTFLIIRLPNKNEEKIKVFCENMRKYEGTFCNYDIGNQGQPRLGITTLLWPEKDEEAFKTWWEELPGRIEEALSDI